MSYREFCKAVKKKEAAAVVRILREHPELHPIEERDGSLLGILYRDAPELLETAFRAGLHPDSANVLTIPFVCHLAAEGDVEVARLALRYGADVERRNDEGESALGYAVSWGNKAIVELLIEAGADVNGLEVAPDGIATPPLNACSDPEIEALMLAHGARRSNE
ncbi:MAG: ankyrin repeat domain-containing protein [Acidobacteria bacterium]|nr:ankyrin repeat domain-containing protein [Acidobacteriota bacterium]